MESWKFYFFCGIKEDFDAIESRLQKGLKEGALYVMSHEVAPNSHHRFEGSHYHFFAQIEDKEYHSFAKWMKDRYNLVGKAKDGNSREYGIVKAIKDQEKAIQYILKDGNFKSNMNSNLIKKLYEQAFKKETTEKDFIDDLFKFIENQILIKYGKDPTQTHLKNSVDIEYCKLTYCSITKQDVICAIIKYYREHNIKTLTRAVANRLYEKFVIYGAGLSETEIYSVLFEETTINKYA